MSDAPGGRDLAECSCRWYRVARELIEQKQWTTDTAMCPWCEVSRYGRHRDDEHAKDCAAALLMDWKRRDR